MHLCEPFLVVHPMHILVHSRVYRAHRLKSAALDRNPIFYSFSRLIVIVANTNAHIYAREQQILTIRIRYLKDTWKNKFRTYIK